MPQRRKQIEEKVSKEKALSFTSLRDNLGLSNGVLQYHLRMSEKIEKKKAAVIEKNFCEDCSLDDLCEQKCLLKTLKKPLKREIIEMKAQNLNQTEIAEEVGLDPSTVHYHIRDLESAGLLKDGKPVEDVKNYLNV